MTKLDAHVEYLNMFVATYFPNLLKMFNYLF